VKLDEDGYGIEGLFNEKIKSEGGFDIFKVFLMQIQGPNIY
jgi:hypothetical protein